MAEDEAIVFEMVEDENGEEQLLAVEDDKIAEQVFNEYYRIFDENNKK